MEQVPAPARARPRHQRSEIVDADLLPALGAHQVPHLDQNRRVQRRQLLVQQARKHPLAEAPTVGRRVAARERVWGIADGAFLGPLRGDGRRVAVLRHDDAPVGGDCPQARAGKERHHRPLKRGDATPLFLVLDRRLPAEGGARLRIRIRRPPDAIVPILPARGLVVVVDGAKGDALPTAVARGDEPPRGDAREVWVVGGGARSPPPVHHAKQFPAPARAPPRQQMGLRQGAVLRLLALGAHQVARQDRNRRVQRPQLLVQQVRKHPLADGRRPLGAEVLARVGAGVVEIATVVSDERIREG